MPFIASCKFHLTPMPCSTGYLPVWHTHTHTHTSLIQFQLPIWVIIFGSGPGKVQWSLCHLNWFIRKQSSGTVQYVCVICVCVCACVWLCVRVCVEQLATALNGIELKQKQNYLIGFRGVETVRPAALPPAPLRSPPSSAAVATSATTSSPSPSSLSSSALDKYCPKLPTSNGDEGNGDDAVVSWPSYQNGRKTLLLPPSLPLPLPLLLPLLILLLL